MTDEEVPLNSSAKEKQPPELAEVHMLSCLDSFDGHFCREQPIDGE